MNRIALMLCGVLLFAVPAAAQTPTVDELLTKNAAARGGAEKLQSMNTRKIIGKVSVQGMEMGMTVLSKRPNLMRQEMTLQDRRMVTGYDGKQAWTINPMLGDTPQLLQGLQADLLRDQAHFDGPLAYARQRGDKMEVAGKELVEGTSAWKLAITRDGKITYIFLDEQTGLERKVSVPVGEGGTQAMIESVISDYQPVDGIMVPRKVQTSVPGQPPATVTIDSIEFNVPIEDSVFAMAGKGA